MTYTVLVCVILWSVVRGLAGWTDGVHLFILAFQVMLLGGWFRTRRSLDYVCGFR
jgi:hypothetical protein